MRLWRWLYIVPLRLRSVFRRNRVEQELDEELRFHLERRIEYEIEAAASPAEARRRALLDLNGLENCKEECRDMRRTRIFDGFVQDCSYALRGLRKSPVFAVTAALTLALAMGALTATYSVAGAVLLRPLPYPQPDRLAVLGPMLSNAEFADLRNATRTLFEDMAGASISRAYVQQADGTTELLMRGLVTPNFFRLMGGRIVLGRDFDESDAVREADPAVLLPPGRAAILSYEFWQRRFGGSAEILGQRMPAAGAGAVEPGPRIVGVLAPGFKLYRYPDNGSDAAPEFWVANNSGYDVAHRNLLLAVPIARLRAGITLAQVREQIRAGKVVGREVRVEMLRQHVIQEVRPAILTLFGAVAFLLLIACSNIANLLLVRASLRERELAVRTAIGAGRWRLMRQILVEAALVSAIGTAAGLGLAWILVRALPALAPAGLPRIESVAIDGSVLAFAVGAGLFAAILFGSLPAWRAARPVVLQTLRGGARGSALYTGRRLRSVVVVAEVALSFVLLIGAGLMLRSFLQLLSIRPGFDPQGLLTFMATRQWDIRRQDGRVELLRRMQSRLGALPGVESVTEALALPLSHPPQPMSITPRREQPGVASADRAEFQQVLPGYFETLRTPLIAGRTFTEQDDRPERNLAVIDEWFAARAFPGQPAIGKRILLPGENSPWVEVIGVVAHQHSASLADSGREQIYLTDGFYGIGLSRHWAIRTRGDPAKLVEAVRRELHQVDPQLVVSRVLPMEAYVEQQTSPTRFALLLIGLVATLALVLASVGLYGVLATMVRQRTAEIGVRIALGAQPSGIFRLVVMQGLRLYASGLVLGVAAALGLTRLMTAMLVGVAPHDPLTYAGVAVLFFTIVCAATCIPASRAAHLQVAVALREE